MKEYGNESISRLKGADKVRKLPSALLGSKGLDGVKQCVYEIVGNATDEKLAGFGDKLYIALNEDNSVEVRDYGRGVPLGWNNSEGEWNYFLIYEDLYAGGKYDEDNENQEILHKIDKEDSWDKFRIEDYPYLISIGMNGLGAAATQCASKFFHVTSYRDGVASRMDYEEGRHILDELVVGKSDEPTGTRAHWLADDTVFTEVAIPSKWFSRLCDSLSYVAGFDVTFNDKGTVKVYKKRSIEDVLREDTGNAILAKDFYHITDDEGDICICDATIAIGSGGRGAEYYQNFVEVNGGVHSNAFNYALSTFFSDIGSTLGIKIREADYSGKFSVICSTLTNKMSPRGQTKDSLDDPYIFQCIYNCIYNALKLEYQKGTEWVLNIIEEVEVMARNRIAVAEMSKNLRNIEKSTKKHDVSAKFHTCLAYEKGRYSEVEYAIVEGDSAGDQVNRARNTAYQCYLSIRGKSLNLYKATIDRLISNREIMDIVASFGCGIDLGIEGYESFDISKLRAGKILFIADADIDGKHILVLLFVLTFKLFPELLYQGYVYVVEPPLFAITTKDNNVIYCMTQEECDEKCAELGRNVHGISRFKGLGEMNAEELWDTVLNPETRHERQIKIDRNDTEIYDVLEVLFGKSTERRKRAILGSMLGVDFDELVSEMESVSEYIDSLGMNNLSIEEIEL